VDNHHYLRNVENYICNSLLTSATDVDPQRYTEYNSASRSGCSVTNSHASTISDTSPFGIASQLMKYGFFHKFRLCYPQEAMHINSYLSTSFLRILIVRCEQHCHNQAMETSGS
jgi:hypothetical protein